MKTTSVTTHFKNLTTRNNVFIVLVIVNSNCHFLQFLHQLFNVSSLLLCVVTEVFLFSVVAFKTLTFHKVVVYRHTWGAVVSLLILLLQIFSWFWQ